MRDEIVRKIEKWQEPPPAKIIKPLKAPDAEGKKRRGGRRLRKMKERYGLTDMRKVRGEGGLTGRPMLTKAGLCTDACWLMLTPAHPLQHTAHRFDPVYPLARPFVRVPPPLGCQPLIQWTTIPLTALIPPQAANRINFNQPEEEYMDGDEVMGLGVLGKGQGSGRLRIVAKEQKMKMSAKTGEDGEGDDVGGTWVGSRGGMRGEERG